MARAITLLIGVALAGVCACADVAGVGDFKKEGEGGAALGASCADGAACGAGLTCAGSQCLRNCFDPATPESTCAAGEGCFPLTDGTAPATGAVCFTAGTNVGGACTDGLECAPGYDCIAYAADPTNKICAHFCHGAGAECTGGNVCLDLNPSVTLDGVRWGICGPVSTSSTSGALQRG